MFIGVSLRSRPRQFPQKSHLSWVVTVVTLQIVSQGELWLVGDEEEEGSDKNVALNCYWFIPLNLFFVCRRLRVREEVQKKSQSLCLYSERVVVIFFPNCPVCWGSRSKAFWETAVKALSYLCIFIYFFPFLYFKSFKLAFSDTVSIFWGWVSQQHQSPQSNKGQK